jgi:hypothetical protein
MRSTELSPDALVVVASSVHRDDGERVGRVEGLQGVADDVRLDESELGRARAESEGRFGRLETARRSQDRASSGVPSAPVLLCFRRGPRRCKGWLVKRERTVELPLLSSWMADELELASSATISGLSSCERLDFRWTGER